MSEDPARNSQESQDKGSGPPPSKRLPDYKYDGPDGKTSAHGFEPDGAEYKAEAVASGQASTVSNSGTLGEGSVRSGFGDASASTSGEASPDGVGASAGASVGAGALSMDGNAPPLAGGLVNITGGGRALAADAEAKGTVKLSREEATLSGKLGASAVLGEVHGKVEIILTPQRVYNGIVVNGVNMYNEWHGFSTRLQAIQNGALDHGLTLELDGGLQDGAKAGVEAHATVGKKGGSIGAGVTPPLSPVSVGASAGFQ